MHHAKYKSKTHKIGGYAICMSVEHDKNELRRSIKGTWKDINDDRGRCKNYCIKWSTSQNSWNISYMYKSATQISV